MQQNKSVQKEVKMTRSQTRGPEGSQSPSAQMGVASRKADSSCTALLPGSPATPLGCVLPHGTHTPTTSCSFGGRGVTGNDEVLSPFVWRSSCGHGCDAFQWLHRVLKGGHTSAESAPLLTRIYLFPGVFVCFVLLPQY